MHIPTCNQICSKCVTCETPGASCTLITHIYQLQLYQLIDLLVDIDDDINCICIS